MRAERLRTEYLDRPLGLGIARPRFSWICTDGITQTAYRLVVSRHSEVIFDSGKRLSSRMVLVPYEGPELHSRDRIDWTITLWDENDRPGEATTTWFEVGLLNSTDWTGSWIAGDYSPKRNTRYPVDHFRREFSSRSDLRRARLYITANGIYQAAINGVRVGEFELAPGSTDYRKRLQYQSYDVTSLLAGEDVLDVELADGWYRGSIGCWGPTNVFGRQTKLKFQLEMEYTDGTREVVTSDPGVRWSNDGPIRFADLKDGEVVDARRTPRLDGFARVAHFDIAPTASDNVDARTHEVFTPVLLTTPGGSRVLDFGQNLAGFVSFLLPAAAGQGLTLTMGEILDDAGEFTQSNMQESKPAREFGRVSEALMVSGKRNLIPGEFRPTPLQKIEYTARDGVNDYTTKFAIFGFRYALIETEIRFDPSQFRAIAVYSAMEQTGEFTCSNPDINQLLENTRWSMKSNFLDVPTDCPTRERLGWTGDAQIFFDTGSYLMDVASFYRKWLRDVQDNQFASGKISAVVPYNGVGLVYDNTGASVGWGDAAVLIPYRFWKRYGDAQIIRDFYPLMRSYSAFMISHSGPKDRRAERDNVDARFLYEKGYQLGEWLEPEEFRDQTVGRGRPSHVEEGTAYLHLTMTCMAEIADELGEETDRAWFAEYAEGAKRAYGGLLADAIPDSDRQAKLVRPLALRLVDGDLREQVERRLVQAVENRGYRVGTGFLSTPFLLPALTAAGRPDVAYRMLENVEAPSWLAEVRAGATTVWEDWEGKSSHNHYSPGAVCQWLFDTVAGIRVDGENHFHIAPRPGGTLSFASADYASLYGPVGSRWEIVDGVTTVTVSVPPNTTADIDLPDGRTYAVGAGSVSYQITP